MREKEGVENKPGGVGEVRVEKKSGGQKTRV